MLPQKVTDGAAIETLESPAIRTTSDSTPVFPGLANQTEQMILKDIIIS
jgi:hypothetical protein